MSKVISFNELRRLKDSLPNGAMQEIADKLSLDVETVRNYFGGQNFKDGGAIGVHLEAGPDGGLVTLDDTTIFDIAVEMLNQKLWNPLISCGCIPCSRNFFKNLYINIVVYNKI